MSFRGTLLDSFKTESRSSVFTSTMIFCSINPPHNSSSSQLNLKSVFTLMSQCIIIPQGGSFICRLLETWDCFIHAQIGWQHNSGWWLPFRFKILVSSLFSLEWCYVLLWQYLPLILWCFSQTWQDDISQCHLVIYPITGVCNVWGKFEQCKRITVHWAVGHPLCVSWCLRYSQSTRISKALTPLVNLHISCGCCDLSSAG